MTTPTKIVGATATAASEAAQALGADRSVVSAICDLFRLNPGPVGPTNGGCTKGRSYDDMSDKSPQDVDGKSQFIDHKRSRPRNGDAQPGR